jgi:hypothetical protein
VAIGFEGGDGGEQAAGVGVRGALEEVGGRAGFDDSSGIHDGDAVADAAHHGEVVGDEEHGQREALAQLGEQGENLRLHGNIEGGGGLVGDEQRGTVDDGHGDHDALALASGELMRVVSPAALGRGDGDLAEGFDGALAGLGAGDGGVVSTDGLGDLVADAHDGVESGHGLLEDHGHAQAAQGLQHLLQTSGAGGGEVAFEEHGAGEPRLRRQQSHDGEGGDALAGAGFADQGEGFARREDERDVAHGGYGAARGGELDGEVLQLQEHERYWNTDGSGG